MLTQRLLPTNRSIHHQGTKNTKEILGFRNNGLVCGAGSTTMKGESRNTERRFKNPR
jgi:hypothetical protein